MKGIILAGGLGTRLYPVTKITNKHALLTYDRPMFYWPLQTLIESGIREIAIVSGPPHGDQIKKLLLEFPNKKKVKMTYITQRTPAGMPDGINKCKKFIGNDSVIVSAADNIYGKNFKKEVAEFKKGALSFLRKVKDPERYAIPLLENNKIVRIIEKPKNPETNWAVTGPHIYDSSIFEKINTLVPSKRGELEISDLNSLYIKEGSFKLQKRADLWLDVGTFDSLLAGSIMLKKRK